MKLWELAFKMSITGGVLAIVSLFLVAELDVKEGSIYHRLCVGLLTACAITVVASVLVMVWAP